MNNPVPKAKKIFVQGEVFENCAYVTVDYTFDGFCGEDVTFTLPYFPNGILCNLSVKCDCEEYSAAKAINIREAFNAPMKKSVSLREISSGIRTLCLKDVCANNRIEISVSVCFLIKRYENFATFTLFGLENPQLCPVDIVFDFHGEFQKFLSPTHRITASVCKEFTKVACRGNMIESNFTLDIFYSKAPQNGLFISRQPLARNIALCRFTPTLLHSNGKRNDFDIHIYILSKKSRSSVLAAAVALLNCLTKNNFFRLVVNSRIVTDFLPGNRKNIDNAISLICSFDEPCTTNFKIDRAKVITICSGADFDRITPVCDLSIICDGPFPNKNIGDAVFTSSDNAEKIIPFEFARRYGKALKNASLIPIGGMNVTMLPPKAENLPKDTVSFAFAIHDVIPPKGIQILDKNRKTAEEIPLAIFSTSLNVKAIDIIFAVTLIHELNKQIKTAKPEERYMYRESINQICIKNNIAMGDIALVCVGNGSNMGFIEKPTSKTGDYEKYFKEEVCIDEILDLILSSQTADGIIADITVSSPTQTVFSTAVCLIALYLYRNRKYRAFARRSLKFLKKQDSYFAKAAIALWKGEEIDFNQLKGRLEMKIMNRRLDELAIILIKRFLKDY